MRISPSSNGFVHKIIDRAIKIDLAATDENQEYDHMASTCHTRPSITRMANACEATSITNVESFWALLKRGVIDTNPEFSAEYLLAN
jgi:hypothetical protein